MPGSIDQRPMLVGEFALNPVGERVEWRQAMARHLLSRIQTDDGFSLPDWKIEDQVTPMNSVIAELVAKGAKDLKDIEKHFRLAGDSGSEHAPSY